VFPGKIKYYPVSACISAVPHEGLRTPGEELPYKKNNAANNGAEDRFFHTTGFVLEQQNRKEKRNLKGECQELKEKIF
jgi:hypothetical protein